MTAGWCVFRVSQRVSLDISARLCDSERMINRLKIFVKYIGNGKVATSCAQCSRQFQFNASYSSLERVNLEKEKEHRVLEVLNNNGRVELMSYPISKIRIEKIERWKSRNGNIKTVDELLQIDGFGVKMLERMCESILKHESKPPIPSNLSNSKRPGAFTHPAIPSASRDHYKSCVSIFTTVSSVSWARIQLSDNGPCHLSHWHHRDITEKRLHITDLVQNLQYIAHTIPEADCYVMENPQIAQAAAPGGAEQVNINVQKAQIMAVLNYALASRTPLNSDHLNMFYLKKYLSSRVFNLLVGNERVSTQQVVTDLLRTTYNMTDWLDNVQESNKNNMDLITLRSNVNVAMELREMYSQAEGYQRDFLGQALLIGMTFIRLCLLRTPETLSMVTRNSKEGVDFGS